MKKIAAVTNGSVGHRDESDNEPHTVSLSAYLIGETEVTQELWKNVMGNELSINGQERMMQMSLKTMRGMIRIATIRHMK